MISGLLRLVVFRLFGARVLLALAILGWIRNRLWPRSRVDADARRGRSTLRRVG